MNINNLNSRIKECQLCSGLNQEVTSECEATLNAPGYGDINSNVLILGQSLCGDPCIESQIPFTDGCGVLLDEAFEESGIRKDQVYITNLVKCHPPGNAASTAEWKVNCGKYLAEELNYTSPTAIICLGKDACEYFSKSSKFGTSIQVELNNHKVEVYFLYHPAYIQNRRPRDERKPYVESIVNIIQSHHK